MILQIGIEFNENALKSTDHNKGPEGPVLRLMIRFDSIESKSQQPIKTLGEINPHTDVSPHFLLTQFRDSLHENPTDAGRPMKGRTAYRYSTKACISLFFRIIDQDRRNAKDRRRSIFPIQFITKKQSSLVEGVLKLETAEEVHKVRHNHEDIRISIAPLHSSNPGLCTIQQ
jgi:hypothetical protein